MITLPLYISRHYLKWFALIFVSLLGVIFIFDVIELLRRTASRPDITYGIILTMAALNLPEVAQKILPFITLFSVMLTFITLTRNQELVIVRAVGVSVWQFLKPVIFTTFILGLFYLFLINPLGALMKKSYRDMEAKYIQRNVLMDVSGSGLWLRQNTESERYLLHADSVTPKPFTLKPLIAFMFDADGKYKGRLDAPEAVLDNGKWVISNAWRNLKDREAEKVAALTLHTDLSVEKIQESMAPPSTVSFWDLPGFISALESTGFPGTRHRMEYFMLIAMPFFLCGMVFCAACFSLGLSRKGGILKNALIGVFAGGFAFTINDMIVTLGINQALPVIVAAFAAPLITLSIGAAALFHLEDG